MKHRTVRIVPWFAGCALSPHVVRHLGIRASSEFVQPDFTEQSKADGASLVLNCRIGHGGQLYIHLFNDGIVLFSIVEGIVEISNIEDFDPDSLQVQKRNTHKWLLSGNHSASTKIERFVDIVREVVSSWVPYRDIEFECKIDKHSYVFSFSKFTFSAADEMDAVAGASDLLLFPLHVSRESLESFVRVDLRREKWEASTDRRAARSVSIGHERILKCSWSTVLEYQVSKDCDISELWRMEREVQHIWFNIYVIETIIGTILHDRNERHRWLARYRRRLINLEFEYFKFEGFGHGNVSAGRLELLSALRETSGIGKKIEKGLEIAKTLEEINRDNYDLDRHKHNISVSVLLTIIASLNVFFAYKAVQTSTYEMVEVIVLSAFIVLSLLVHYLFFRRT